MSKSGHLLALGVNLAFGLVVAASAPVAGQSPDRPATAEPSQPSEQAEQAEDPDGLTDQQRAEVADAIDALGSSEFAVRERAASQLLQFGLPILPDLRAVAKESSDPEVRLRARQLVKQLTRGDLEARIAEFLNGGEVNFAGWRVARSVMGESYRVRELFVELLRDHHDVLESLEGTPRDRAIALEATVNRIETAMFVDHTFPTRADAFALLLPAAFPDVELDTPFETLLLDVLRKEAASKLRRDVQLSGPFNGLVSRWIRRSTLANREEVLRLGLQWQLDAALNLAIQTLGESNQTETVALALQTIARFGSPQHAAVIRPLLDDTRLVSERGFGPNDVVRTELRDVAMAAIAVLHNVPLKEAGFRDGETHPTLAFLLNKVGFPVAEPEARDAARAKIEELLDDGVPVEGS